jgi:glycosyltransferase involved in cell wall biosynthesis
VHNIEVVLVSDGCPEDLTDLERLDPRVRLLLREHAGVSAARNAGVAHSVAPFVAFLDEDDLAHPGRIRWQMDQLDARPRSGMCHGSFDVIDGDGSLLVESCGGALQYREMLALEFPLLSTVMVRRSHFQEVGGFDPDLITGEDIEFFLRSAMRTEVSFVPNVVTSYRRHGSNTSTGVWDIRPILRRHRRWAELSVRPDLVAAADIGLKRNRRNASRSAFDDARSAHRRGEPLVVAKHLAVSLAREPRFVAGIAWSRVTRRPECSPEGRMPG